jgi:hypothetical protein
MTMVTSHWWSWPRHDLSSRTQNSWLSHVFLLPIKKISEQPCFNGEPMRHTVLWEEIRTTHKLPESPMGHVPMGTTEPWRCVSMNQCVGSPSPSSRHHRDRTRTLVSWSPRHRVTPLSSRKPNANRKSTKRTRWMVSVNKVSVLVMKDEELKVEETEAFHTLGGAMKWTSTH